jgi:hypothetical protein
MRRLALLVLVPVVASCDALTGPRHYCAPHSDTTYIHWTLVSAAGDTVPITSRVVTGPQTVCTTHPPH